FVSSRRRHTRFSRDWSSDVCSSDLNMAKKNKPGESRKKHKGYQAGRSNWEAGKGLWSIAVPKDKAQESRTFSMEEALPAGERSRSDERRGGKGVADRGRTTGEATAS